MSAERKGDVEASFGMWAFLSPPFLHVSADIYIFKRHIQAPAFPSVSCLSIFPCMSRTALFPCTWQRALRLRTRVSLTFYLFWAEAGTVDNIL